MELSKTAGGYAMHIVKNDERMWCGTKNDPNGFKKEGEIKDVTCNRCLSVYAGRTNGYKIK